MTKIIKQTRESTFNVKLADAQSLQVINDWRANNSLSPIDMDPDKGILVGYMSTFNNTDQGGDIVRPGAFTKTLSERTPKVLFQHNANQPIGIVLSAVQDTKGLLAVIQLNMDTQLGKEVFSNYKMGAMDSFSIGYQLEKFEPIVDGKGKSAKVTGYDIQEVKLMEVSAVTFPMNEEAVIMGVKQQFEENIINKDEINQETLEKSLDDVIALYKTLYKSKAAEEKNSETKEPTKFSHSLDELIKLYKKDK